MAGWLKVLVWIHIKTKKNMFSLVFLTFIDYHIISYNYRFQSAFWSVGMRCLVTITSIDPKTNQFGRCTYSSQVLLNSCWYVLWIESILYKHTYIIVCVFEQSPVTNRLEYIFWILSRFCDRWSNLLHANKELEHCSFFQ